MQPWRSDEPPAGCVLQHDPVDAHGGAATWQRPTAAWRRSPVLFGGRPGVAGGHSGWCPVTPEPRDVDDPVAASVLGEEPGDAACTAVRRAPSGRPAAGVRSSHYLRRAARTGAARGGRFERAIVARPPTRRIGRVVRQRLAEAVVGPERPRAFDPRILRRTPSAGRRHAADGGERRTGDRSPRPSSRSSTTAMPSSSLEAVTSSATAFSPAWALAIATPWAAQANIGMSLGMSPKAMVSAAFTPSRRAASERPGGLGQPQRQQLHDALARPW